MSDYPGEKLMLVIYRVVMVLMVVFLVGAALLSILAPVSTARWQEAATTGYLLLIPGALLVFAVVALLRRLTLVGLTSLALVVIWAILKLIT